MKEEVQGFPIVRGSIGFPLHPKALGVSENETSFEKTKLDHLTPEAGVLIQSGGKRLWARFPQPLVEAPNANFELFIETTHPMSVRHSEREAKSKICLPVQ